MIDLMEDSRPRIEVVDVLTFEPDANTLGYYRAFRPKEPAVEIPLAIENALRHALGLQLRTLTKYAFVKLMRILETVINQGQDSITLYFVVMEYFTRKNPHFQLEKVVYTDLQQIKAIFEVYKGYIAVRKKIRRVERHLARVAKVHRRLEIRFQAFQEQVARVTEKAENLPAFRLVKEQEQVRARAKELLREVAKEREKIEKTLEVAKEKKGVVERAKDFVKSAVSKLVNMITSPFSRVFGKKDSPGPGGRKP